MSVAPLVVSSLAASVAAGVFLVIGLHVQRREVEPEARQAMSLYSMWWTGLAVYAMNEALLNLAAAFSFPFALALAFRLAQVVAFTIGLWGLAYYVSFILTGRRGFMAPLAVVYALYYATILFAIVLGQPNGIRTGAWEADLAYETPALPTPALTALLVLPPLVAAVTYGALWFSAPTRAHRGRVALVSLGMLGWLGSIVVKDGAMGETWAAIPLMLGLVSAAVVMWAYHPPKWLARALAQAR